MSDAVRLLTRDIGQYESKLPSEAHLTNEALNPSAASQGAGQFASRDNPLIAQTLQRNATVLAQAAQAFAADQGLSLPTGLGDVGFGALLEAVGQKAFDHDASIRTLAVDGALSTIDTLVEGPLAAIPFVGAAALVIWNVVQAVYAAAGNESALPPLFRMNPVDDDQDTKAAIARVKGEHLSDDWTPIFLPRGRDEWKMQQNDGGWQFWRDAEDGYDASMDRLGCAPGDLFYVDNGLVQSRITSDNVTIPSNARSPRWSNVLQTGENPQSFHSLVFPTGQWYPSLSAFGRSVWSMVGTRGSTALFQIDAAKVADEWAQFATATAYFRADMDRASQGRLSNLSKPQKRDQIAGFLSNFAASLHTLRVRDDEGNLRELSQEQLIAAALDPAKRSSDETVGKQAIRHANNLEKRQRQAAKTPLNALVTKDAPALRGNADLRQHFMRHRSMQLDAGKFDGVALDDVPDPVLRQRLEERQRRPDDGLPTTFASPDKVADQQAMRREFQASLKTIDRPLGFGGFGAEPDPDDRTGGGFGLAVAGLAVAGLAGGGALLYRSRRRRTA
ncbi:MAG: hypothetical protein ACE37F_14210 [Nannocystaceae bacterium]|nr:hypothetical protein [bacterium]